MNNYYKNLDHDIYIENFFKNKLIQAKNDILKTKIKILTFQNLVSSAQFFYSQIQSQLALHQ